jgi:ferritin-like metal-binding protein YciE
MPQISDPQQLFTHKLGAALTMENTVLEMLQQLEGKAQDPQLKQGLQKHRQETQQQIQNIEQAFQQLGEQPQPQPCPAIDGLKEEGQMMLQQVSPELADSVIVGGAAETEHHEISVYEGLITKAQAMGQQQLVQLFEQNLQQEQNMLQQTQQKTQQLSQELAQQPA